MKNIIGNFEGIDIVLKERVDNRSILSCDFEDKTLEMAIDNQGEFEVIQTNMNRAQAYYISNSVRELFMVYIKSKVGAAG